MGLLDNLGASDIVEGVDFAGLGSTLLIVGVIVILAIIIGVVVFLYYTRKYRKIAFKNQIPIFLDIAGKLQRIGIDFGKELFVPDSNISLYFLRNRKIYLARPTRAMGKDEYWYKILENGEWVNFNLSNHPDDNTLAIANYDHRDTRYAYVNLKDIIKKNYKDKATKWWKEYSGVITIIITALMFVGVMWFFFWRTGTMISDMQPLSENLKAVGESLLESSRNLQNINSGVVQAG